MEQDKLNHPNQESKDTQDPKDTKDTKQPSKKPLRELSTSELQCRIIINTFVMFNILGIFIYLVGYDYGFLDSVVKGFEIGIYSSAVMLFLTIVLLAVERAIFYLPDDIDKFDKGNKGPKGSGGMI